VTLLKHDRILYKSLYHFPVSEATGSDSEGRDIFYRRKAAFHRGCVAKGRRLANVSEATSRAPSQEGVWVQITAALCNRYQYFLTARWKLHPRGNCIAVPPQKTLFL
jgi:hypothetical protein